MKTYLDYVLHMLPEALEKVKNFHSVFMICFILGVLLMFLFTKMNH